jgi:microtubule-associated protein-like 6
MDIHNWSTFTSLRHKEVKGVWNKFAEKTDIVTIDGNEHAGVIAAGDELGLIKLFRFPSEKRGAHFRKYVGHSSKIGMSEKRISEKKQRFIFLCS